MISKLFDLLFGGDTEFSKRWMLRVTTAVLLVFLFVVPFALLLIFLNMKYGLSFRMCKTLFSSYVSLLKVTVTGYFATFIGYMGKAFLAKREEENNKLKKKSKDGDI